MTMQQWDDHPARAHSTANGAPTLEPDATSPGQNPGGPAIGPVAESQPASASEDLCRALYDACIAKGSQILSAAATSFVSGDVLAGRYVINDLLGRGGMGEVYAAF